MLRLLIDENFNPRILRGLIRRRPSLDFVLAEHAGLKQADDLDVLTWAAGQNRIILTHDIKTLVPDAKQIISSGQSMVGVILVPYRMDIGEPLMISKS